ncbi:uncharacterized protein N7443_006953 [Penicillium atrosanguineum]|uniref:uncharacterized protein n=1 Tax=Penicillium atrosanguineum TaxID=1132637 RepID=UPI00239651E7|nr:uncharacterized protein N7443_006953 [Penicillium atrosanguineum]KAJ5298833.1 hypothetical protein N7443_006953 [Penicillium atrosanguineum]
MGTGKELAPSTLSRICSLRTSAKWSYSRIRDEYPSIPRSTIVDTCRKEVIRGQENTSRKRVGRPQILSEFDRDLIYDAIQEKPSIKYDSLLDLVNHKIGRETLRKLLREFGIRKWRENAEWTFTRPKDQAREGEVKPIPLGKQLRQMFWASFSGDLRRIALIPLFGHPESPRGGVNSIRILETYQQWLPTLIYNRSEAILCTMALGRILRVEYLTGYQIKSTLLWIGQPIRQT